MPQLLLELFSEEIPARMQGQAARDLERMARERLAETGFLPEALKTFAGPRRLTLVVEGLPPAQPDRNEERKGPRVGAPDAAIQGFLRSTGLSPDQLTQRDGVWYAQIARQGRPTSEIIAEMVEAIVRGFPWPKSMKWGTGSLRWVRPLQRILCVFDGEVVPFQIDGIKSGSTSEGHRFMGSRGAFRARNFDDYEADLRRNFVLLDVEERKLTIQMDARSACWVRGFELVEDEGLLDEVAGLAEWPTVVFGDMDPTFLELPPEVIRTSMRTHQKYFAVKYRSGVLTPQEHVVITPDGQVMWTEGDPDIPAEIGAEMAAERALREQGTEGLAPHFITVANIRATDGGAAIAAGNARVLSARLSDAQFFWDEDRKVTLESRLEKLRGVTFHAKLGTMFERVERIEALARQIAPLVGADVGPAAQAARLAKADLGTGMVGEFPELQGLMGGYYARAEGLDTPVADAIRDHYKPQGPSDAVPSAPVSIAVALADKLDTLAGFFAIDEKPTGSRDPFALRRAALGVIRILLESHLRIGLKAVVREHLERVRLQGEERRRAEAIREGRLSSTPVTIGDEPSTEAAILAFFADRLKVLLRDQGKRHDLVDAVFALGDDDLVRIVARVEAIDAFLRTDDGANLLAGYKRASNILRAEEKKGPLPTGAAVAIAGAPAEEAALIAALATARPAVADALIGEDFAGAMRALADLRQPVDGFFDKVLVNADDATERDNRLRLLTQVNEAMGRLADFSQVVG